MALTIFLSHSTHDDAVVAVLREALESHNVSVWADSQRLSAGEALTPRIRQAIADAQHCVVLLSPRACTSEWVRKEIQLALEVQRSRSDGYKVIPVLYDGVTTDAIPGLLGEDVVAVTLGKDSNAIPEVLPDLLAALGLRLPDDRRRIVSRTSAPLAELTYRSPDGAPAV